MSKLPVHIESLSEATKNLSKERGFAQAQKVINAVVKLLGIEAEKNWKAFTDSQGKIRSNAGWFMEAEGFADRRAAYKIAEGNAKSVDLKAFWLKKASKSIISWLVALTPNYEDEPFYGNLNLGLDFVIPEKADRVIVILSKNYVIRTLELSGELSVTQQEIFAKWLQGFDFANKAQVHDVLWQSFDIEPLNKRFYKEISSFFIELKDYLKKANIFDDRHASYFVNRLIGRIVFCWFLKKKGLINPEIGYFETEDKTANEYYRNKLEILFFKVFNTPIEERDLGVDPKTPFLNGGLFDPKDGDKFGDNSLTFPADYFDRLLTFLKHYNFTTDESTSTFQQVAIDPEMLGRIFENLLAEQVEETGEQARKAKGAFYTPREIVDYMCRESLREYLKTKLPDNEDRDERISQLLDSKEHEWRDQNRNFRRDIKPYKYDILKALDEMKIIDPACGSGAFPMGMLALLIEVYERLDATFDPYKKKLEIIKNNLYGVDIEPMAVEISRLRAWLSIVVDEDNIEPLPNLDFKFVCANSLLPLKSEGGLFDKQNLKEEMQEVRDRYYNARTKKSKADLKKRFEKLIEGGQKNMFASEKENQLKSYHPFDEEQVAEFFDPEFMFGVSGFDVVIGNPPYVNSKKIDKSVRGIYWDLYKEVLVGDMDLYQIFFVFGIKLLNEKGVLAFVSSNSYLTNQSFRLLRDYFLKNTKIVSIHDFPHRFFPFKAVNTETSFAILTKQKNESQKQNIGVCVCGKSRKKIDLSIDKYTTLPPLEKYNGFFLAISDTALNILKKNEKNIIDFPNIFCLSNPSSLDRKERYPSTKNSNYEKCIFSEDDLSQDEELKDISDSCITGDKILRYLIHGNPMYTNILWKKNGVDKRINSKTYSMMKMPKLVGQRITGQAKWRIVFSYDDAGLISMPSVNIITLVNSHCDTGVLLCLLGVLNSKLYNYLYKQIFQENNTNITSDVFDIIPIPESSLKSEKLREKVDQILIAKKDNPKADTSDLEAQIDELVFDLYELTPEEREVVRNS